jgi:hypothetical protein
MNLTRERIRQVEVKGLAKLEALKDMAALRDYVDEGPIGKRRLPVLTRNDGDGDDVEDIEDDVDDTDDTVAVDRDEADAEEEFDVEAFAAGDDD